MSAPESQIVDPQPKFGKEYGVSPVHFMGKDFHIVNEDSDQIYETRNLCVICGMDMGDCNPRQFCGKVRCLSPPWSKIESGEVDSEGFYIGFILDNMPALVPVTYNLHCTDCGRDIEKGSLCGMIYCLESLDKLRAELSDSLAPIPESSAFCVKCGTDLDEEDDQLCGGTYCFNKS